MPVKRDLARFTGCHVERKRNFAPHVEWQQVWRQAFGCTTSFNNALTLDVARIA